MRVELPNWVAEPWPERSLHGPGLVWGVGAAVPIALAIYALTCMVSARAVMLGYNETVVLYGSNAVIFGISTFAFAILLHCACYWDSLLESTRLCARIKLMCLAVMGTCSYALCFRMLYGHWL